MRRDARRILDHDAIEKIAVRARRERAAAMGRFFVKSLEALARVAKLIRVTAAACTAARLHRGDRNHDAYGAA
jgi:hypothetical protein